MAPTTSTDAERAARRQADRERLEQAARALLSSEGWQRWMRVRASNGLARYSLGNQLLIALQKPDATFVAGFRAFLKLNRCVRKGEKAIRILAPMTVRRRAPEEPDDDDQHRTLFRSVAVFDTLSRVRCWGHRICGRPVVGGEVEQRCDVSCAVARVRSRGAATIPCHGARVFAGGGTRGRRALDAVARQDCGSAEMSTCGACSGACWTSAAARNR